MQPTSACFDTPTIPGHAVTRQLAAGYGHVGCGCWRLLLGEHTLINCSRVVSSRGVGSKAARAAGLECIVCVRPTTENLSCPRCAAAFCATCIREWWKAHPSKYVRRPRTLRTKGFHTPRFTRGRQTATPLDVEPSAVARTRGGALRIKPFGPLGLQKFLLDTGTAQTARLVGWTLARKSFSIVPKSRPLPTSCSIHASVAPRTSGAIACSTSANYTKRAHSTAAISTGTPTTWICTLHAAPMLSGTPCRSLCRER